AREPGKRLTRERLRKSWGPPLTVSRKAAGRAAPPSGKARLYPSPATARARNTSHGTFSVGFRRLLTPAAISRKMTSTTERPMTMAEKTSRPTVNSEAAFLKAKQVMPGGVSSPVRAFKAVGGTPLFIKEGDGCHIKDVDGNIYIDYVASYGPLIAGHSNERVVAALSKAIGRGTSFGAPTEGEVQLAAAIVSALPAVEML